MHGKTLFSFLALLCISLQGFTNPIEVSSPDGTLRVLFSVDKGKPYYQLLRFGQELIGPSRLGLVLKNQRPLSENFAIAATSTSSFDETWTQPWGEKKDIRNHYNELRVTLIETTARPRKMELVFRVYDDGLGFRYEIPKQNGLDRFEIQDELTEFVLAKDAKAWWIPAFQPNRYEYLYRCTPVSEINVVHTPLTLEIANSIYLSIHEAALIDYASMTLALKENRILKAELMPWSDGIKVKTKAPMKSPWRTIQIADDPGGLITSYLILNLNEPNKLEDISWIRPQKYIGIWWAMHLGLATWSTGPKHGATTENAKRYIDFAAKYGFDGVLIEGWNVGWDGDWVAHGDQFQFTKPTPDFDIEEVARYAKEKGVELIGHHETGAAVLNYEKQMKDAFAFYEKLGVHTVKTGYVNFGQNIKRIDEKGKEQKEWHHGQFMVRHHQKVVEEAAKHHIMIDIHEPIKDTGLRRTYPNLLTREGARGQEYDAWDAEGGNPPEHQTILPFTRLLAGPMDYTPGIFRLTFPEIRPNNQVNTTLAKQLALYVVIYSPLQMAADLPENYEKNPEPFKFILDVPVDWEETRVLHARIGDYVTIVRKDRKSDDWYLGSVTDEEGRILEAPLYFLEPGQSYLAEIYRDGDHAHWKTNPYEMVIEKQIVNASTILKLKLAPGGGEAIRFSKIKQ